MTSVRLENEFWRILDQLAADQSMTTARFICTLHSEVRGDVRNLASLLRVTCVLFLHQQALAAQSMLEPMRARA